MDENETPIFDRIIIVNITLVVEAIVLLAATIWSYKSQISLANSLSVKPTYMGYGILAGLCLALSSFLLFWLGKFIPGLKNLRTFICEQIAPIFSCLTFLDIVLIAAASGFCEEIFFRGVAQKEFGLLPTSLIFGLFHCPSIAHLSYGLWAALAGLFLGYLYIASSNLWVPIMAHFLSNFISLLILKHFVKSKEEAVLK